MIGLADNRDRPVPGPVYSSLDVTSITGVSLRQLQWWDEQGVVTPLQKGHRRLYNTDEVLQVSLIMGLRRKGMSLQKIRRVLGKIGDDNGGMFLEMHSSGRDVFLLTDGETVHVENSAQRIVDLLKDATLPIITLCVSDLIRLLEPTSDQRKPVHSAGRTSHEARVTKAS